MQFGHEKLEVYQLELQFISWLDFGLLGGLNR